MTVVPEDQLEQLKNIFDMGSRIKRPPIRKNAYPTMSQINQSHTLKFFLPNLG